MASDEFQALYDETVTGHTRPMEPKDVEFLKAAVRGQEFEPETLDHMRYMRLYYLGYVAISFDGEAFNSQSSEWPVAHITLHGSQLLEAVAALTPVAEPAPAKAHAHSVQFAIETCECGFEAPDEYDVPSGHDTHEEARGER